MANVSEERCEAADLTPGAAFVVHLAVRSAADATTAAEERGRVEHVLSGAAAYFHSIADLVAFMSETIAQGQACEKSAASADADSVRRVRATADSI